MEQLSKVPVTSEYKKFLVKFPDLSVLSTCDVSDPTALRVLSRSQLVRPSDCDRVKHWAHSMANRAPFFHQTPTHNNNLIDLLRQIFKGIIVPFNHDPWHRYPSILLRTQIYGQQQWPVDHEREGPRIRQSQRLTIRGFGGPRSPPSSNQYRATSRTATGPVTS